MNKSKFLFFPIYVTSAFIISGFFAEAVFAHCPLCTIGAGAIAIGASWLGISSFSIGIFLGAFAIALGLWIGRLIKKRFIPHQTLIIGIISFLTTIIPLRPLLYDNIGIFISLAGDYGGWLNRTYLIDRYILGSIIGALIILFGPKISIWISSRRNNKLIPYQGMIITFGLLIIASLIYEILV